MDPPRTIITIRRISGSRDPARPIDFKAIDDGPPRCVRVIIPGQRRDNRPVTIIPVSLRWIDDEIIARVVILLGCSRTAAVAAASRSRGCRGDARIPRDDVLHRARRTLTRSRPDNEDDWQDAAAARAAADRPPPRAAASSCHLGFSREHRDVR